ncbi:hypothetical protein LMG33818_002495 [Halomonadaceae bacterium LMG 33818]|uniref:hypothetical protein n=1 Tax=Cernens ardua TaxID=3402176 RepID=UPI003EDC3B15
MDKYSLVSGGLHSTRIMHRDGRIMGASECCMLLNLFHDRINKMEEEIRQIDRDDDEHELRETLRYLELIDK